MKTTIRSVTSLLLGSATLALVAAAALAACGKKSNEMDGEAVKTAGQTAVAAAPAAADSPAKAEAKALFGSLCATCHGASGRGDGAAAAGLNPKPRDYSDKEWQKSVTDEQIATVILKGGAAIGKSPTMPPAPQLESKPEVVAELVKMIRAYGE